MLLSVIIPTFNRKNTLKECINALIRQDFPKTDFEIIIVDDGSRDETADLAGKFSRDYSNIHYYHQLNQGQGIARNLGISKACGKIIVFIGDDMIAAPSFLTEHMRFHLRYPEENSAVLGYTTWHPKLQITPFMRWLENGSSILGKFGGHQFAYEKLKGKLLADYNFFYTINISLKKSLLEKQKFDPAFAGYGWEDIELGYRLFRQEGLKIYYNPDAMGYHDHLIAENSLAERMKQVGRSAVIFDRKYPELKKVPRGLKKMIFFILSNELTIVILKAVRVLSQGQFSGLYFYALSKRFFLEGMKQK